MPRTLFLLALLLALAGCWGASTGSPIPSPLPTSTLVPADSRPVPTFPPILPSTPLPYPPPATVPGGPVPYPQPKPRTSYPFPPPTLGIINPTPLLEPTPFPTLAPDILRSTLLDALTVAQAAPGAYQIGGWPGGWRSDGYCRTGPLAWLDENRLLLFPLAGIHYEMGPTEFSVPLVADLARGTLWLPYPAGEVVFASGSCADQPAWSSPAGVLAATQPESAYLYSFAGGFRQELPRQYYDDLGVSPSGRWLFTGQEFVDLGAEAIPSPQPPQGGRYAWDPAEQQVFACCNLSAVRGSPPATWEPEGIAPLGRGVGSGAVVLTTAWSPGGSYAYVFWDYDYQSETVKGAIVPLFDPAQQTFVDLLELAGLEASSPEENWCRPMAVSPDSRQLLLACQIGGWFLVDLETYQARSLGSSTQVNPLFSANGEFLVNVAALKPPGSGTSSVQFWLTEDGTTFFASLPPGNPLWHPTRPWLTVLRSGEPGVTLFDARQRTVVTEIGTAAPVRQALWAPQGDGLLLALEDGRLAWLANPLFSQDPVILNEIPHDELRGLQISPDGRRVALVDGGRVYVYPLP